MYLLIFEYGTIRVTNKITNADKMAVDEGVLDIVDISGDYPLIYNSDEKWSEVVSS